MASMTSRCNLGVQLQKYLQRSFSTATQLKNRCRQQTEMSTEANGSISKPMECAIRQKLTNSFNPVHLDILNESYMHNVPPGSETHFKVVIVSDKFDNLPLIKRHRMVNDTLEHELKNGIHALSIMAKTPVQWEHGGKEVKPSPACRGGFGK